MPDSKMISSPPKKQRISLSLFLFLCLSLAVDIFACLSVKGKDLSFKGKDAVHGCQAANRFPVRQKTETWCYWKSSQRIPRIQMILNADFFFCFILLFCFCCLRENCIISSTFVWLCYSLQSTCFFFLHILLIIFVAMFLWL